MEEESRRNPRGGVMKKESFRSNDEGKIMRRNDGGGIMADIMGEASWRIGHPGITRYTRRHQGGTSRHPEGIQEAPGKHKGGTQDAPRRSPRLQKPLKVRSRTPIS